MRERSAAHIKHNIWLWMALLVAAMAASAGLRWGTTTAVLGLLLGILLMWKSDEARLASLAAEQAVEEAAA